MFLVDSHCHLHQLNYENIHKDISDVLMKAYRKGVQLVLSVSTDLLDYNNMIQYIGYRNDVVFSCGIHPINLCNKKDIHYNNTLYDLASQNNVVAIGETGLDYYHCTKSEDKHIQIESFRKHIAIAKDLNKPLIVHSRNSIVDTITILREESAEKCGGILHCFNEDIDAARSLLNMNFFISFSGMITFRNIDINKDIIQYVPLNRILLETDSPYLTPVPYRKNENQPAYIYDIAKYIANIKKVSVKQIALSTTSNFHTLLHISTIWNK